MEIDIDVNVKGISRLILFPVVKLLGQRKCSW